MREGPRAFSALAPSPARGGGFRAAPFVCSPNLAVELTSLMQDVIVDTTGALYAAGQLSVGLRLGFNGVLLLRKPAAIYGGVCPVLGRLGMGAAL